jgi:YidC/Oxa1 family membrane protein insertase
MFELIASLIDLLFRLTSSYGVAIILLTVIVRLLLFPLTAKQTRSMQGMARLQPEIKKLQETHGADRQKLNEEVMKLYREHKVNPAGGCLPLLLQAPIFIGLYRVVNGLTRNIELDGLMIRVAHPQYLPSDSKLYRSLVGSGGQMRSFGIDLAQSAQSVTGSAFTRLPYIVLVVLVGATGYLQQVIMNRQQGAPATAQAAQMQKVMKFLPVFFAFISFNIQAAVVLYWIVGNVWMIGQSQVLRKLNPPPATDDAATLVVDTTTTVGGDSKAASGSGQPNSGKSNSGKSGVSKSGSGKSNKSGKPAGASSATAASTKAASVKTDTAAALDAAKRSAQDRATRSAKGNKDGQSAIAAARAAARTGRSKQR